MFVHCSCLHRARTFKRPPHCFVRLCSKREGNASGAAEGEAQPLLQVGARTSGGVSRAMVIISRPHLPRSSACSRRSCIAAGVMLALSTVGQTLAVSTTPGAAAAMRRLSPGQLSGLHGLAATLMQRNPTLASGIAEGLVSIDTRSIRSVDGKCPPLPSLLPTPCPAYLLHWFQCLLECVCVRAAYEVMSWAGCSAAMSRIPCLDALCLAGWRYDERTHICV